jgi:hypothetical protein
VDSDIESPVTVLDDPAPNTIAIPKITSNEQIRALEQSIYSLPQVDLNTENLIHGRMCARTIFVPKGTVLTGAQTNVDNICIVFGDITVTTSNGNKRLTGFHVLPADAGFKRAGIAHEDTCWTTIHHTELSTLSDIEKEMTDEHATLQSKAEPLLTGKDKLCLGE